MLKYLEYVNSLLEVDNRAGFLFSNAKHKKGYWTHRGHQREFFDKYAEIMRFSSNEDWYKVSFGNIAAVGGRSILAYYNDSIMKGNLLLDCPYLVSSSGIVP